ncbi:hypothetical protein N2152v2_001829 [Parachlorella kessleri]
MTSTGEIEYIEAGQRRWFSEEAWASTGPPDLILEETGDCPKLKACPEGPPMPVLTQADLSAASPDPDASPSPALGASPSPELDDSPRPDPEGPTSPQQPSPSPQQLPSPRPPQQPPSPKQLSPSPQQPSPSPKQPSPSPQQPSPSPKQQSPSPQLAPAGRKQPSPSPQRAPSSPRQPSPRPTALSPKPSPQAKPRSPQPSPAPTRPDFSGGSCPDPAAALNYHNYIRQQHGAAPLTWSPQLAASAQKFANSCAFKHSGGPFGENIRRKLKLTAARERRVSGGDDWQQQDMVVPWKTLVAISIGKKVAVLVLAKLYGIPRLYRRAQKGARLVLPAASRPLWARRIQTAFRFPDRLIASVRGSGSQKAAPAWAAPLAVAPAATPSAATAATSRLALARQKLQQGRLRGQAATTRLRFLASGFRQRLQDASQRVRLAAPQQALPRVLSSPLPWAAHPLGSFAAQPLLPTNGSVSSISGGSPIAAAAAAGRLGPAGMQAVLHRARSLKSSVQARGREYLQKAVHRHNNRRERLRYWKGLNAALV